MLSGSCAVRPWRSPPKGCQSAVLPCKSLASFPSCNSTARSSSSVQRPPVSALCSLAALRLCAARSSSSFAALTRCDGWHVDFLSFPALSMR